MNTVIKGTFNRNIKKSAPKLIFNQLHYQWDDEAVLRRAFSISSKRLPTLGCGLAVLSFLNSSAVN
jgi:hypothetical protein